MSHSYIFSSDVGLSSTRVCDAAASALGPLILGPNIKLDLQPCAEALLFLNSVCAKFRAGPRPWGLINVGR